MKKIISLCAVGASLVFAGCTETWDGNPVLKGHEGIPVVDFLNHPVMQDQEIMLTEDNATGTFHLTCSQPDFGYAVVATYKVRVSLTEDFAKYKEISQSFYDCANINPQNGDVAEAIQELSGVKTEADLPVAVTPVYMRLYCYLEQSKENTQYLSNVVKYKGVGTAPGYLALWVSGLPTNIYLRGALPGAEGWEAIDRYNFVTGDSKDTWKLENVTIAKDTEFKIADPGWGSGGYNFGQGSSPITADDVKNKKKVGLSAGSMDNLKMPVDFTGKVILGLESGNYYVKFEPAE